MTLANPVQTTTADIEFKRGLIVGKFCPLHLGHELLINTALQQCRELILISYSKPEFPDYGRERREAWLQTRFPQTRCLVIDDEYLQIEAEKRGLDNLPVIPHNDDPEHEHRIFVGWLCQFFLNQSRRCNAWFANRNRRRTGCCRKSRCCTPYLRLAGFRRSPGCNPESHRGWCHRW